MLEYQFKFSETASVHLSIIRVIAAHLVVIGHGIMGRISPIGGAILGAPGLGVFFCMSGLLISYSTLKRKNDKKYEFKRFVVKRFSKIHPALFISLIIMTIVDFFFYVYRGNADILNSYNIPTFLWNLLILQDSFVGPTCFGTSRQLWPFPLFWWTYLFFGWMILGYRNTKKHYFYALVLTGFSLILVFIIAGPWTLNKLDYISLWFLGALFGYGINKFDLYLKEKMDSKTQEGANKLKNRVKYGSLAASLILYVLSAIRVLTHQDPYGTIMLLLLNASFLLFIVFSQYVHINVPEKLKKGAHFFAGYTYSLFLIQYAAGYIISFIFNLGPILYIIFTYILTNIIAIAIGYLTEMRASKIENYLLKKFNLTT
jgi:peptidoglycan/LPS O-acetylase OafA/YrhL